MSNIINRLRASAVAWVTEPFNYPGTAALLQEAANEIERLNSVIACLRNELPRLHVQAAQDEALLQQALEALEFVRSIESLGMVTDGTAKKAIAALRERLGEGEPR